MAQLATAVQLAPMQTKPEALWRGSEGQEGRQWEPSLRSRSHKGATGKPQGPPGTKEAKNSACIHCSARDTRALEPLTATSGLGCLYSLVGILPGC